MKNIPYRMCVVSREKLPKKDLIRIVYNDGKVNIDLTGKQNGKGCYFKRDASVIELAKKRKILDSIFAINVDDAIYDELNKML